MLKGLIGQEALLKQELAAARRNSERADKLNVEYLKNIVLSSLDLCLLSISLLLSFSVRFDPSTLLTSISQFSIGIGLWVVLH